MIGWSPMPTVKLPSDSISPSLNRLIRWKSANTSCLELEKNKEKCYCCRKDVISWKYTVLELDYGSLIHFWWIKLSFFNRLFTWAGPHDFHKSVYTYIIQTWDFKTGHSKSLEFNVYLINRKPIFLLFFHTYSESFLSWSFRSSILTLATVLLNAIKVLKI